MSTLALAHAWRIVATRTLPRSSNDSTTLAERAWAKGVT
jgi:hypothetical protein